MLTRDTSAHRAGRWAVRLVLALACAAGGCGREREATTEEEGPLPDREHLEKRFAPLVMTESTVSPPVAESPPVPQDPVAAERARAAKLVQLRKDYLGAYERHGRRNPKWDIAARKALEAWVRVQARPDIVVNDAVTPHEAGRRGMEGNHRGLESGTDDQIIAWEAARQAVDADCNDPLIRYILAWLSYDECANHAVEDRSWALAAEGMRASNYPALFRAYAFARRADYLTRMAFNRNDAQPEAQALLDEATALIPEVSREARGDPTKAWSAYHLGTLVVDGLMRLPGQERSPGRTWQALEKALNHVTSTLNTDPANQLNSLLLAGDRYNYLAWELRGGGPNIEVSGEGWSDFDSRLGQAEWALTRAYERDPKCPDVCRLMIEVEKGQGKGRERMEAWFERAMRLNSDDYLACRAKLEYLEPRWYGSEAEMLAFGRACRDTKNWEGRLPFILVEAHRRLARTSLSRGRLEDLSEGYYARPYVWNDIKSVYEPYLAKHPESLYDKSCYARLATLACQFKLADQLFKELGDKWWRSVFAGGADYEFLKDAASNGKAGHRPLPINRPPFPREPPNPKGEAGKNSVT